MLNNKKSISKLQFFFLIALIAFLPFSSWLVSITGKLEISLMRDVLIFIILTLGLLAKPKLDMKSVIFPIGLFSFWCLISFFWREDSAVQWIRGLRLTLGPFALLFSLVQSRFTSRQWTIILYTMVTFGVFVALLGLIEIFGLRVPLTSSLSGPGSLTDIHGVTGTSLKRLQSILAGPNALGLYMLVLLGSVVSTNKLIPRKYLMGLSALFVIVLIFTYSRSAWLGLAVAIFVLIYFFSVTKNKIILLLGIAMLASAITFVLLQKNSQFTNRILTHSDPTTENSSDLRFVQYKRIWSNKKEIGFFGKGLGTAGPSSQNRLDGGPNNWSENVYLDTFEELGVMGLLLFVSIFIKIIYDFYLKIFCSKNYLFVGGLVLACSFCVAGIFINFYTGQIAIYTFMIVLGYYLNEKVEENAKNID